MSKPLRETMPHTTAFIDQMREAFGVEDINAAIRAGINGQPTFYASEGGHQIGTKRTGGTLAPATVFEPIEAVLARSKRGAGK